MNIISSGFFAVAVAILLVIFGAVAALESAHTGKRGVLTMSGAAGIFTAVLCALLMGAATDAARGIAMPLAAIFAFAITIVPGIYISGKGSVYRRRLNEAPAVKQEGLKLFTRITSGGQINRGDLEKALAKTSWNDAERNILEHMYAEFNEIGHVVAISTPIGAMPVGGHAPAIGGTVRTYNISREDLETYPSRRRAKWSAWLN